VLAAGGRAVTDRRLDESAERIGVGRIEEIAAGIDVAAGLRTRSIPRKSRPDQNCSAIPGTLQNREFKEGRKAEAEAAQRLTTLPRHFGLWPS
jgi:hypothetical protein